MDNIKHNRLQYFQNGYTYLNYIDMNNNINKGCLFSTSKHSEKQKLILKSTISDYQEYGLIYEKFEINFKDVQHRQLKDIIQSSKKIILHEYRSFIVHQELCRCLQRILRFEKKMNEQSTRVLLEKFLLNQNQYEILNFNPENIQRKELRIDKNLKFHQNIELWNDQLTKYLIRLLNKDRIMKNYFMQKSYNLDFFQNSIINDQVVRYHKLQNRNKISLILDLRIYLDRFFDRQFIVNDTNIDKMYGKKSLELELIGLQISDKYSLLQILSLILQNSYFYQLIVLKNIVLNLKIDIFKIVNEKQSVVDLKVIFKQYNLNVIFNHNTFTQVQIFNKFSKKYHQISKLKDENCFILLIRNPEYNNNMVQNNIFQDPLLQKTINLIINKFDKLNQSHNFLKFKISKPSQYLKIHYPEFYYNNNNKLDNKTDDLMKQYNLVLTNQQSKENKFDSKIYSLPKQKKSHNIKYNILDFRFNYFNNFQSLEKVQNRFWMIKKIKNYILKKRIMIMSSKLCLKQIYIMQKSENNIVISQQWFCKLLKTIRSKTKRNKVVPLKYEMPFAKTERIFLLGTLISCIDIYKNDPIIVFFDQASSIIRDPVNFQLRGEKTTAVTRECFKSNTNWSLLLGCSYEKIQLWNVHKTSTVIANNTNFLLRLQDTLLEEFSKSSNQRPQVVFMDNVGVNYSAYLVEQLDKALQIFNASRSKKAIIQQVYNVRNSSEISMIESLFRNIKYKLAYSGNLQSDTDFKEQVQQLNIIINMIKTSKLKEQQIDFVLKLMRVNNKSNIYGYQ